MNDEPAGHGNLNRKSNRNSPNRRKLKHKLFGGRETAPCCFCRCRLTMASATLEHVVPMSQGGGYNIENLRLSCQGCNLSRGDQPFSAYRDKVRKSKEP